MDNLVIYDHIAQCVTMSGVAQKRGRNITEEDLGIIADAAMVVDTDTNLIKWVGPSKMLPKHFKEVVNQYSGEGEVWMPELVECHTHLIYAGHRHHDYALRCQGKSYLDIAKEGGGILSTLTATRDARQSQLIESAQMELERFQRYGVGTIEIKTGYGLTLETEIIALECIQALQDNSSVTLVPTFMPGHAVPPEFKGRTDDYVNEVCAEWIPEVAKLKLTKFFDVFIEEGYFNVQQARKMLETAKAHGMALKVHADQFNDIGGTPLAMELGATSIDHLDHVSDENVKRLAASNTVAVLLPGASLFTGTPYPPARKLIDAGAIVALSTDYNPGTCPSRNLPLMTTIACSQMKMTIPEAIAAVTYNAAAALGLEKELGSLENGKTFRACQLKADSYEVLPYCFGELE